MLQCWSILSQIGRLISDFVNSQNSTDPKSIDILCTFTEKQIAEIFYKCFGYGETITQEFLAEFSRDKETIKDIWLTPIIKVKGRYKIFPSAMSVNFQWVSEKLVNKYFNAEALKARKMELGFEKGNLFERNIQEYFSQEIPSNKLLPIGSCEVILNGIDYKDHENEEIDIVFRLGSSFLIVEAKALTFGTNVQDYQNIRKRLLESKIKRKRQDFIDEFEKFRSR